MPSVSEATSSLLLTQMRAPHSVTALAVLGSPDYFPLSTNTNKGIKEVKNDFFPSGKVIGLFTGLETEQILNSTIQS